MKKWITCVEEAINVNKLWDFVFVVSTYIIIFR
jgi:hypothetical protein